MAGIAWWKWSAATTSDQPWCIALRPSLKSQTPSTCSHSCRWWSAHKIRVLSRIGETLIGSVISGDESLRAAALNSTHIDRLNLGAVPTIQLNWLQPHEGNIIDFLYRNRAYQEGEL